MACSRSHNREPPQDQPVASRERREAGVAANVSLHGTSPWHLEIELSTSTSRKVVIRVFRVSDGIGAATWLPQTSEASAISRSPKLAMRFPHPNFKLAFVYSPGLPLTSYPEHDNFEPWDGHHWPKVMPSY